MCRFLDDVDHPRCRANIDVSHLLLAGVPAEELRRLKGRACHVHISGLRRQGAWRLAARSGRRPFAPYLREIARLASRGGFD
ncbi:MAG: hypothetical protein R3B90_16560 [Planctomycetaceae bacterium]